MRRSNVRLAVTSLFVLLVLAGCNSGVPYEITLADSHGNGGWVLFDSAPESYEKGRTTALEEGAKVKVTGSAVDGLFGAIKLYPVTVLSGKYAGHAGWVASAALGK